MSEYTWFFQWRQQKGQRSKKWAINFKVPYESHLASSDYAVQSKHFVGLNLHIQLVSCPSIISCSQIRIIKKKLFQTLFFDLKLEMSDWTWDEPDNFLFILQVIWGKVIKVSSLARKPPWCVLIFIFQKCSSCQHH